ncbi:MULTISPECIES: aldehyde dehydrogenase family protein [Halomonadaceae]|jgi:aldehyde dehydrogenase (NAD+)|uniref:aldehyde dehydrogenase family protein n=1 Tax=Halomonadaceae TaxID=28256 RepID=UPI0012F34CC2|nr:MULTISPECIES: aldehyde dehydrogenase family protein [Halomonas]CAD5259592.1 gamma-Glu-gamma-aminobutyraldehyde dehydrogenase, NAD(P)H-dependent [Halomonas sp. 59]CAD5259864.1 gamma-Glu-gamma-aminobutyraldehyde dehydrogenase, NAD(P)H-dependent [Halomonas sp. 113]CAD5273845.1 gamma-Glu-gamma-aminobutyraldehyde dehydrogenase, NAD(P)H-dependent [Halomonas sp. I3]CAD5288856.1 gamma-Glu-gamma-aminobutyraldehyde dehydrogenase, NAD(P)H-dependent [Halomonas sp. 156]VXB36250.1 gamma-Glu-gamma-aminobu
MPSFDPGRIALPCAHFIQGQRVSDSSALSVSRPSDGAVYAELPMADASRVDDAVTSAHQAFLRGEWSRCAPRERARIMRRWADLIEADIDYLAPLESLGSTRPIDQARAWDVPYTAEGIRFFAEFADKHGGEVAATAHDHLGMQIAEPLGVVGAIAPWNFPLSMTCWKVAPALAAGNTVVLKPSEMTPFTAVRLAELAIEAGMPPGVFNVIQGNGPLTGDALCRHPYVAKVTFTGSTVTGRTIMGACAETGPKPVTLELGGKSPQLVFADIPDIDRTAKTLAAAITGNAGQVCVAGSRLLIQRELLEPMIERLSGLFQALTPGHTWKTGGWFSPIISNTQLERIESIVARAREAGAELLSGGERFERNDGGHFYQPTLLHMNDRHNPAVEEEIFGPVLTIQTFENEEEALALAEHDVYGLAAGIHTADLGRALRTVKSLSAGTVWVNRYGRSNDYILPTGGYKRSGVGRDLGRAAFDACLQHKSVLIDLNQ